MSFSKRLFGTLLIVSTIGFNNCSEENICVKCSENNYHGKIESEYFTVSAAGKYSTLVSIDSISREAYSYSFCDSLFAEKNSLEDTKVIKLTAEVFDSCDETGQFIRVNEFIVLDSCLPNIKEISGSVDFFGIWDIKEIITNGNSTLLPCELTNLVSVRFYKQNNGKLIISGMLMESEFEMDSNSISLSRDQIILLMEYPTFAGNAFHRSFLTDIFSNGTELTYTLENNFLNIKNASNNAQINLYKK